jgi:hypothetical protein
MCGHRRRQLSTGVSPANPRLALFRKNRGAYPLSPTGLRPRIACATDRVDAIRQVSDVAMGDAIAR